MSAFGRLKVGRPIRPERLTPSRAAASASEFAANSSPSAWRSRSRRPASPAPAAGQSKPEPMSVAKAKRTSGRLSAQAPHDVGDGLRLAAVGFQELEPRRRGGEEVARLDPRARRLARRARSGLFTPSSTTSLKRRAARPAAGCGFRAATPRRSTAAPRRESRTSAMASRSPSGIFEVAWRSTERPRSAASMPAPSSATRMRRRPPASMAISTCASRRRRARSRRVP